MPRAFRATGVSDLNNTIKSQALGNIQKMYAISEDPAPTDWKTIVDETGPGFLKAIYIGLDEEGFVYSVRVTMDGQAPLEFSPSEIANWLGDLATNKAPISTPYMGITETWTNTPRSGYFIFDAGFESSLKVEVKSNNLGKTMTGLVLYELHT